jgi:4-amino-4-deoxy-L-arabinose transferase-like glycosyltransferase
LRSNQRLKRAISIAIFLMMGLTLELCLAGRQQSQTFDEADHILAGYRYWKCLDFAANPEHPPMLKLVASFPLLFQNLAVPIPLCAAAHNDFLDGRSFLYSNNADSILFRTRLFASCFTVALAALLFAFGYITFGVETALIALTIFVFEPSILAHAFLVTTDMAVTCCLFASCAAFYVYLEKRTMRWLVFTGIAAGMTLAAKHSGILVIPILGMLAVIELATANKSSATQHPESMRRRFSRLAFASACILLIAYVTLWGFYAFRFSAQSGSSAISDSAPAERTEDRSLSQKVFRGALRVHVLPEAYLYGIKHVLAIQRSGGPTFILGKLYPTGKWFYFPAVLLVKWTLGFLLLLLLGAATLALAKPNRRRALFFLTIPPLLFLIACLPSKLNIGIRHVLPVAPFVILLASTGAWEFCKLRAGKYVVGGLLLLHVGSSLASFPNYIPYSNEIFGGTSHTYRVLAESNVDWGQSFKAIHDYVHKNAVNDCWVAYLSSAEPSYYQTGCKLLPSTLGWMSRDEMPGPQVQGTVFIGTWVLTGPDEVNPYAQFRNAVPIDNIGGTVLVFRGAFDLPWAFASAQINRANTLSDEGHVVEAVHMAQNAVESAPDYFPSHAALAHTLKANHQPDDARKEYQLALSLAQRVHPEYQQREILQFEKELRSLP